MPRLNSILSRRLHRLYHLGLAAGLAGLWLLVGLGLISQAQQPQLQVYINAVGAVNVDDPLVIITATVLGLDGQPILGLDQVQVIEAGNAVSPSISVAAAPLNLVLAFDLSYDSTADWRSAAALAQTLVNSLQPGDRLRVMRFHGQVEAEMIELEAGSQAIVANDSRLAPTGDHTALYRAVLAATELLQHPEPAWQGRQAVIVITNIADNTDLAANVKAELLTQTVSAAVPVYIFSFSDKAKNEPTLDEIAQATGGEHFHTNAASELSELLADRVARLRPAYRLTFLPVYRPGPIEHLFKVSVRQGELTSSAAASYTFQAREPKLVLPVQEWVYLGQPLEITATVQMPFPVQSVQYQLGDRVETVAAPPYRFVWPAEQPGQFPLVITVTDRVAQSHFNPYTITVANRPGPVQQNILPYGQPLLLKVTEDRFASVDRVELYEGDTLLHSDSDAEFQLILQPGDEGYPQEPGQRTFSVKIFDRSGRLIEVQTIQVQFTAPEVAPWWVWPLTSTLLILVVNFPLLPFLLAIWKDNYQAELLRLGQTCEFKLKNTGNVPTGFEIKVESEKEVLLFKLTQLHPALPDDTENQVGPVQAASPPPGRRLSTWIPAPLTGVTRTVGQLFGASQTALAASSQASVLPGVGVFPARLHQSISRQKMLWYSWLRLVGRLKGPLSQLFKHFTGKTDWPQLKVMMPQEPVQSGESEADRSSPPHETTTPSPAVKTPRSVVDFGWQTKSSLPMKGLLEPGEEGKFRLDIQPRMLDNQPEVFKYSVESHPIVDGDTESQKRVREAKFRPRAWVYRYFGLLTSLLVGFVVVADIVWGLLLLRLYLA